MLLSFNIIKSCILSIIVISGYVYDADSGESLIGATVVDTVSGEAAITNNSGFYSLTINDEDRKAHTDNDEVNIALKYSYLYYNSEIRNVSMKYDSKINVGLKMAQRELKGVVVSASSSNVSVNNAQMSAINVPVSHINSIPAMLSEVDVIKALQLLPGVQSGIEGSASLYVRGGGPDENFLMMDGVPLYNVNHLFGFVSVFNSDAIKNIMLYKGSFPARFGGRLSSIVDVRLNDGDDKEFHGDISIGAISSKISLEGPIVKGNTTFIISARRSYIDALSRPLISLYNDHAINDASVSDDNLGLYHFYDFNAKITHKFKNNDKLYFSVYSGDDVANIDIERTNIDIGSQDNTKYVIGNQNTNLDWKWGNFMSMLRWSHQITPRMFLNVVSSYSRYNNDVKIDVTNNDISYVNISSESSLIYTGMKMDYISSIYDYASCMDFEFTPNQTHSVKFGVNYIYHTFKPSVMSYQSNELDTIYGDRNIYSHDVSIYGEDNIKISNRFNVNLGLRYNIYNVTNSSYFSLEPRVCLNYGISENWYLKASYSKMNQNVHLLSNNNLSLPTDLWVPVTDKIPTMSSHQYVVGSYYSFKLFNFSIEGYYKSMDNVLEYKDGSSFVGSTSGWEDKVYLGRGWSYGVECFIHKKIGRFTGWIGYTLSKTQRKFDKEGNIINNGKTFNAKYDRTHDLSVTFSYEINKKCNISSTFVYGSGTCGTLGDQVYYDPFSQREYDYYENKNNYRMPSYNRLDIGLNLFHYNKRGGKTTWNFACYNVYNRKNPFVIVVDNADDGSTELKQKSVFPIIPSISYSYKF